MGRDDILRIIDAAYEAKQEKEQELKEIRGKDGTVYKKCYVFEKILMPCKPATREDKDLGLCIKISCSNHSKVIVLRARPKTCDFGS